MTKIPGSDEGPLKDRLQDFIRQAEVQFGPRNREWVLDGIKFSEADTPNRSGSVAARLVDVFKLTPVASMV
jgi:hypothetical protein